MVLCLLPPFFDLDLFFFSSLSYVRHFGVFLLELSPSCDSLGVSRLACYCCRCFWLPASFFSSQPAFGLLHPHSLVVCLSGFVVGLVGSRISAYFFAAPSVTQSWRFCGFLSFPVVRCLQYEVLGLNRHRAIGAHICILCPNDVFFNALESSRSCKKKYTYPRS